MTLYNAQQLIAGEKFSEAVDLLTGFRSKTLKRQQPPFSGPEGYGYALVDLTIGNCFLMMDRPADALTFYAGAVNLRKEFHEAWMNLAKCQYDLNRYPDAGKSFLRAYETAPSPRPELLYYGAVSFLLCERHKAALGVFERLLSDHPEDVLPDWKESLVQVYLALEMSRQALPVIEELAEMTEGDKQKRWQEVLLYHYLSLNMKDTALSYVKRLTRKQPLEPKWWKGQVHLYLQDNRYREALVAMTVKELLTPHSHTELALAGDLNLSLGIPVQAVKYYERYLNRKMDREILIRAVQGYMRRNDPDQALKWVNAGLRNWSDHRLFMLKGNLLYQQEKYRDAASAFMAATKSKPREAGEAWIMAGYASWYAGDMADSESALVKASHYKGRKKAASEMLAEIRKLRQQKGKGIQTNAPNTP